LKLVVNENLVPQLYVSDLPFLVLLAIWLGELVTRKSRVSVPREMTLLFAFIAWCLFTVISAPAQYLGLVWAFYEFKMVLVLLWFINASFSRATLRVAVATVMVVVALQGVFTIVNYRWQIGPELLRGLVSQTETRLEVRRGPARQTGADYVYETGSLLRGTGTVGTGNAQAKFFVALLPLTLAFTFVPSAGVLRLLSVSCFALGAGALYLTYSRGGLIVAVVGTGIFLFLQFLGGQIQRKTFITLIVVGLLGLGAATPYLFHFFTSRPGFFQIRLDHWRLGATFATESPLTGKGVNNFNVAVRENDRAGVFASMPVHNHYLRLAVETGVPGLMLQLLFLFGIIRHGYRAIFSDDPFLAITATALLAGVLSILVYWMDDIFYDVIIRTEFAVLLGLIFVVRQLTVHDAPAPA
jgi:O-antigen ligase